jgi:hypothetical protein
MALIKCRECGNEISDQAKKCIHCGVPIKKKITFTKLILIFFLVLIILVIISMPRPENRPSSAHSSTKSTETLHYNLSVDELQVAQNKLNFIETASWFGGDVEAGKVFKQYINLSVAAKSKDKNKLMQIAQFYRNRFEGCQWLSITFYPSVEYAPRTKEEEYIFLDNAFALYTYPPGEVSLY